MRGEKRLVFLDAYSLLIYIARLGVSGVDLQRMFCFGFGQDLVLKELEGQDIISDLQQVFETADRAWCADVRDFAVAAWRLAEREHRISIHHPNDQWPWSPLNDLLRRHGVPPVWQLEPPTPRERLGPDALENARRLSCHYPWAMSWINSASGILRVGLWHGGNLIGWPPCLVPLSQQ